MCTTSFGATTRCQYHWGGGPQVNKCEQVSSDDPPDVTSMGVGMSGGRVGFQRMAMSGGGGRYPSSHVQRGWYHTVAGSNFWTRDGFCCNVTNKYLYRFGEKSIITTRKRTCGKVMFLHLSVILFMGGVWLWVWGYTPLWSHPLDTHPPDTHTLDTPLTYTSLDTHTPLETPPGHTHPWTHTPLDTHTPWTHTPP